MIEHPQLSDERRERIARIRQNLEGGTKALLWSDVTWLLRLAELSPGEVSREPDATPTCEMLMATYARCGAPAAWRYPAMGGGFMHLCVEHGQPHAAYAEPIPLAQPSQPPERVENKYRYCLTQIPVLCRILSCLSFTALSSS